MRISRIVKLKNYRVFQDFTWPSKNMLKDFGRCNLIYGWNGSGKTSLSKIFRAMEKGKGKELEGEITVQIDGKDIRSKDFEGQTFPVRVFNSDFRDENVFHKEEGMEQILILGEEEIKEARQIRDLREKLERQTEKLQRVRDKQMDLEAKYDNFCMAEAKSIKENVRSNIENYYTYYDKKRYGKRAKEIHSEGKKESHLLEGGSIQKCKARLLSKEQELKLLELNYSLPDFESLQKEVTSLLKAVMISPATIKQLQEDTEVADWVYDGLGLHKRRRTTKCFFCEQPIPVSQLERLRAHFDKGYRKILSELKEKIKLIKLDVKEAQEAEQSLYRPAEFDRGFATEATSVRVALCSELKAATVFLEELIKKLKEKIGHKYEEMEMNLEVALPKVVAIEKYNNLIKKSNKERKCFRANIEDAQMKLEKHYIADKVDEYGKYKKELKEGGCAITNAVEAKTRLETELENLLRGRGASLRTVEELNKDLHHYLGHAEIQLERQDRHYKLMRNNALAESFSEGEKTAIALVYFLKSLKDKSFPIEEGIVVLDDPTSSLDANALYSALGFIRERTEGAGQLTILTHEFTFFRHVRKWFSKEEKRDCRFYMLDRKGEQEPRSYEIQVLDPLLAKYESEYHYLFYYIYKRVKSEEDSDKSLERNYIIPNIARRLLEAFLAFRRPENVSLQSALNSIKYDSKKKDHLLRFLDVYSHKQGIGEDQHDPSLLYGTRSALNDLLDLMEKEDGDHFKGMVRSLGVRNAPSTIKSG